jgi:hypothetical protein
VSRPLRTVGATARCRDKLRIALVERRIFQNEQDVGVDPELQVADRQQNTRWFLTAAVNLFEASRERLFLQIGGGLCQEQSMAYADLIGIERLDCFGNKVGQLESRSDEHGRLAHLRRDLLDAVLRFVQCEQGAEALRLLHRMNLGANQVLDELRFERFGIAHLPDANGHGILTG